MLCSTIETVWVLSIPSSFTGAIQSLERKERTAASIIIVGILKIGKIINFPNFSILLSVYFCFVFVLFFISGLGLGLERGRGGGGKSPSQTPLFTALDVLHHQKENKMVHSVSLRHLWKMPHPLICFTKTAYS